MSCNINRPKSHVHKGCNITPVHPPLYRKCVEASCCRLLVTGVDFHMYITYVQRVCTKSEWFLLIITYISKSVGMNSEGGVTRNPLTDRP